MTSIGVEELTGIIIALIIGCVVSLGLSIINLKSDIKELKEEVNRIIKNFTL